MSTLYYISTNLKVLRCRKKLTQQSVADFIKVPRPTYSGWETGLSVPSIENIMLLADYFHITIDHLIRTDLSKIIEFNLRKILKP